MNKHIEAIKIGQFNKLNGGCVRSTAVGNKEVIIKMNTVQKKIAKLFADSISDQPEKALPERNNENWASVDKVNLS